MAYVISCPNVTDKVETPGVRRPHVTCFSIDWLRGSQALIIVNCRKLISFFSSLLSFFHYNIKQLLTAITNYCPIRRILVHLYDISTFPTSSTTNRNHGRHLGSSSHPHYYLLYVTSALRSPELQQKLMQSQSLPSVYGQSRDAGWVSRLTLFSSLDEDANVEQICSSTFA